jgi:hypothetical protein
VDSKLVLVAERRYLPACCLVIVVATLAMVGAWATALVPRVTVPESSERVVTFTFESASSPNGRLPDVRLMAPGAQWGEDFAVSGANTMATASASPGRFNPT